MSVWTENEIQILKDNYVTLCNSKLETLLSQKTRKQIVAKAHSLSLKKQNTSTYSNNAEVLLKDTVESWYWVGFILADGSILHRANGSSVTISIKLAKTDSEHLYKFLSYIQYSNKVETGTNQTGYSGCEYVRAAITSKLFKELALKFDLKDNKTVNPPSSILTSTNEALILSFLVGYIDGDGGVEKSKQQIKFTVHSSWRHILEQFRAFLISKYKLPLANVGINSRGYAFWSINKSTCKLLKEDAKILNLPLLDRKWDLLG